MRVRTGGSLRCMPMAAGEGTEPGDRSPDSGPGAGPASALPSVQARTLAFLAIVAAGICGALIGLSFVRLQCHGNCTTPIGLGGFTGAIVAAGGVAIVSVLTLRAMGEWHTIKEGREHDAERFLEAEGLGPEVREPPALGPDSQGTGADTGTDGTIGPPGQDDSTSRRNPSA